MPLNSSMYLETDTKESIRRCIPLERSAQEQVHVQTFVHLLHVAFLLYLFNVH